MQLIDIDKVIIPDRQRKKMEPGKVSVLIDSIKSKGLLHAIVLRDDGETLVAGQRRLTAISQMKVEYMYNGEAVAAHQVPFIRLEDLTPAELLEAELEENLIRIDLTWQERCQAFTKIYEAKKLEDPKRSMLSISTELVEKTTGEKVESPNRGKVKTTRIQMEKAVAIAPYLNDPKISKAKSADEAYNVLLAEAENRFRAEWNKRFEAARSVHKCVQGDMREVLPTMVGRGADVIICDPPYGINADRMDRVQVGHAYDDTPEYAMEISKFIISMGFQVCTNKAHLLMFTDIENFVMLRDFAKQQGWSVWRTPLIWHKGNEGYAPWGRRGYIRTYEIALWIMKGQREADRPGPDVFSISRPERGERQHAAEKPVTVYYHLLKSLVDPGNLIIDPCCGSGSVFPAADKLHCNAIGIERDEGYHASAINRIADLIPKAAE